MLLAVTPDSFIPDDHPIRRINPIVDAAAAALAAVRHDVLNGGADLDPARSICSRRA